MSYCVGIDIGTTNLCALVVGSESYDVVDVASCRNDTLIESDNPACFEQDAGAIICKVIDLLKELLDKTDIDKTLITGIAITGQMHGVVLVNGNGDCVTPLISWRDRRSEDEGYLAEIVKMLPDNYPEKSGCRLSAGFGGATLSWIFADKSKADKYTGTHALTIMDYLGAVLTGRRCTDYSNAAGWGVFDIENNVWNSQMLQVMGVPEEIMPEVLASGEVIGRVLPEIMSELSLSKELDVFVPIGDNQASYFGAGRGQSGVAVVNLGTSGQLTVPSKTVCVENGLETRPLPGGGYILVGAILCGGWAYDYLSGFFQEVIEKIGGVRLSKDEVYANMKELIGKEYDQHGGGIEVVTRFSGSRSGLGLQKGSVVGIDEANLTPGNLIYGFLRGIIDELAHMLPDKYLAADGSDFGELIATGNAIRLNTVLLDIIEDVFKKKCSLSVVEEEAAAGAAFFALSNSCR